MHPLRLLLLPILAFALVATGGCVSSRKKDYEPAVVRLLLEADGRDASGIVLRLPSSGVTIPVEPKSYFTEYDIESCEVVDTDLGKSLAFRLTETAGRDLFQLSVPNRGKRIVTTINGLPVGARRIEGAISQGFWLTYVETQDIDLAKLAKEITRTSVDARKEIEKKQR